MIQFKRNGPYEKTSPSQVTSPLSVKTIGLGTAGVHVIDQMVLDTEGLSNLLCLDTDIQTIAGSIVSEKYLIGKKSLKGLGARGDVDLAQVLFEDEKNDIRNHLQNVEVAIVIVGLGGGTGAGMVQGVLDLLTEVNAYKIVLTIAPFQIEGKRRLTQAHQMAQRIRKSADVVLMFSNERIAKACEFDADPREIYRMVDELIGQASQSIIHLMNGCGGNPVQLNFQNFQQLVGSTTALSSELENCWIGIGRASGERREQLIVEEALNSPFFLDGKAWKAGDNLFAIVEGGEELSVSEYQSIIDYLKKQLPSEISIQASATVNPQLQDDLRLTLFVGRSGELEVVTEEFEEYGIESVEIVEESVPMLVSAGSSVFSQQNNLKRNSQYSVEQSELQFDTRLLHGRFEKSDPTILNGENMDIPTFLRMGLKIRL